MRRYVILRMYYYIQVHRAVYHDYFSYEMRRMYHIINKVICYCYN